MKEGRPTWLDIPIDIQGAKIFKVNKLKKFKPKKELKSKIQIKYLLKISKMIRNSKRPVFWFGNGIKLSNSGLMVEKVLKNFHFLLL